MEEATILYGVNGVVKTKVITAKKIKAQISIDGTTVNAYEGRDEVGTINWVIFKDAYIIELRPVTEDKDDTSGQIQD
jgi:hypothetical protein